MLDICEKARHFGSTQRMAAVITESMSAIVVAAVAVEDIVAVAEVVKHVMLV